MTVALAAVLLLAQVQASTIPLPQGAGGIPAGPWSVGFVTLAVRDSAGERAPFTAGIWYPARGDVTRHLTYRDYVLADAGAEDLDGLVAFLASQGAPAAAVRDWLEEPMLATPAAAPAGGRHPVVLMAQGNGQTLHDQAPLSEYLASQGYVVATAPSPMRRTGPLTDESQVGARAAEQAADLGLLLAAVVRRPDAAQGRFGVVGHSFGARAALLLAMYDSAVAALVSLDGGIGTAAGRASLEAAPGFRTTAVRAPILHLYQELDDLMAPDFGLLRSLDRADRWLVSVPAMHHHQFTSLGAAAADHPRLRGATKATAESAASYAAVARATRDFLAAYLRGTPETLERMREAAGWPPLRKPLLLSSGGS